MSEVLAEVNDTQLGLWVQWKKGDRGRGPEERREGERGEEGKESRGEEGREGGGRGEEEGGREEVKKGQ